MVEFTGVTEAVLSGFGAGILIGLGAVALLWGVSYLVERLYSKPEDVTKAVDEEKSATHGLTLVASDRKLLHDQRNDKEQRKAA